MSFINSYGDELKKKTAGFLELSYRGKPTLLSSAVFDNFALGLA
jgi:hypothetical protein